MKIHLVVNQKTKFFLYQQKLKHNILANSEVSVYTNALIFVMVKTHYLI